VELRLVLRQSISRLGLLPAEIAVPDKVSGKVDTLQVVLNVHLPTVAEPSAGTLVAALRANNILQQVLVASHK